VIRYRNEAHFSRELCKHFTSYGYFVQRIETRETGRGVPDLYIGLPNQQYWIELKRIKENKPKKGGFPVPWRSGQQAWMYKHYRKTRVPCFTFIAFNDCIVAIAHVRMYPHDIVHLNDIIKWWVKIEDVRL